MTLLRWNEVTKRVGVPPSTARYWRDQFAEYIPCVGDGNARRYKPEAVDVLVFVRDCMAAQMPAEDVAQALAARYARTIEQPRAATGEPQGAAILAEAIRQAVAEAQTEQMQLLRAEIAHLTGEIVARDELAAARDEELRALLAERLPASNTGAWERLKRRLGMI